METTLCLIKPDGVRRGLVGEILSRFERMGLKITAMKLMIADAGLAGRHYTYEDIAVRHGEAVRNSLIQFITSGPVVAAVLEGPRAVAAFRQLAGGTDPVEKATPGTIRGDFGLETQFNLVHGSDSTDSAEREIALWFPSA